MQQALTFTKNLEQYFRSTRLQTSRALTSAGCHATTTKPTMPAEAEGSPVRMEDLEASLGDRELSYPNQAGKTGGRNAAFAGRLC